MSRNLSASPAPQVSLDDYLNAHGLERGAPVGIAAGTISIDVQVVRELQCPSCRHVGLSLLPCHDGEGEYRGLAVCGRCQAVEEM
jgi:hypothetical protein